MITVTHSGTVYPNWSPDDLLAAGVPAATIGAALKKSAITEITKFAEEYRDKILPASPRKLDAYQVKLRIARDPNAANAAKLAAFDEEAAARSLDRAGLAALVIAKADASETAALTIEAQEAVAKAAVNSIADDATNIQDLIAEALTAAKTIAAAAYEAAQTTLNGGA